MFEPFEIKPATFNNVAHEVSFGLSEAPTTDNNGFIKTAGFLGRLEHPEEPLSDPQGVPIYPEIQLS